MDVFGKRHRVVGGLLSVAPDWYVWFWAYLLTTGSAAAVVYLSHDMWPRAHQAIAYGLILANQISSYVLLLSDPGIYPRRQPPDEPPPSADGTADAEKGEGRSYCRHCRLYRPPRCSHCYVCGVCILEHDHHCVLLGVCVGKRSMRWFVVYLVTTTLQLYAGMFFLILSFRRTPFEEDWKRLPPPDGAHAWTPEAAEAFNNHAAFTILFHLSVMGIIAVLMVPVTVGTVAYVLLPLTNTTWREAKRDGIHLRKPEDFRRHFWISQLFVNIHKMLCAGPSLLSTRGKK
ncbi:unspecified product [Leptomonas pyrrhocoris]|uniref:Palmitoyltransferase n=1 Tax=Leptomonas pyrrhocoris TaxID=157538 RepID=A0A0N0DZP7_LEPPY|nr:unspecified product [Leptomonas pyrrhocoris]KPA85551.1 unspecified product [Leptomonas pyrrhocoris]|eukprot:XP_015663990.1 unspecified product [Leptomonas pyrrhocoris]